MTARLGTALIGERGTLRVGQAAVRIGCADDTVVHSVTPRSTRTFAHVTSVDFVQVLAAGPAGKTVVIANFLTQRKIGERLTAWLETLLKGPKLKSIKLAIKCKILHQFKTLLANEGALIFNKSPSKCWRPNSALSNLIK